MLMRINVSLINIFIQITRVDSLTILDFKIGWIFLVNLQIVLENLEFQLIFQ